MNIDCLRTALGAGELSEEISQGLVDTVAVEGYVHYLGGGDGFSGVYICQTYQILHFKYVQLLYILIHLFLKTYLKNVYLVKNIFLFYMPTLLLLFKHVKYFVSKNGYIKRKMERAWVSDVITKLPYQLFSLQPCVPQHEKIKRNKFFKTANLKIFLLL